jgi:subtilisin family serine protease
MKKFFAACLTAALGVALLAPAATHSQKVIPSDKSAPQVKYIGKGKSAIPGHYIVVFHDWATGDKGKYSVAPALAGTMKDIYGGEVEHTYQFAINGFSAKMSKEQAVALSQDPRVAYVEEDGVMTASVTQSGATQGIDRIDQTNLPLNGTYTYNFDGTGVRAYVIDTGILTSHTQFGGRASAVFDALGGSGQDCNGHGTHVAGTIGGSTYGVAKNVMLRAVRVLDCNGSGSTSGVISGVDWVTNNHISPAVANMSLGGGASSALDTSVSNSIASGVTYSIAAGNSNVDACTTSPARVAAAITVGATTASNDARASFSNFGTCVDIFAPGVNITSAWDTSTTATNTISGTSMATPHVVGATALYLQAFPGSSPAAIRNALVNGATLNHVTNPGAGSPNRLLFTRFF